MAFLNRYICCIDVVYGPAYSGLCTQAGLDIPSVVFRAGFTKSAILDLPQTIVSIKSVLHAFMYCMYCRPSCSQYSQPFSSQKELKLVFSRVQT